MTDRKPLSIRIISIIMSILMVLLCLNDWTFTAGAAGDPITITIIDDNGVTHTNAEKTVADGGYGATVNFDGLKLNGKTINDTDAIKDGDTLSFSLHWDAGAFETATSDGSAEFTFIVDNLKKCKNVEPYFETVSRETSTSYATYIYDPANGQMTVTVHPKANHPNGHFGNCNVDMTINVNSADLIDGKIDLSPLFDKSYTYAPGSLSIAKASSGSLYKSGDSWYQDFNINLNVSSGTMKNITVTDTFETGVFSAPTNVSLDGAAISAPVTGNTFNVDIASLSAGAHTLTYSLKVDPDAVTESIKNGDTSLDNKAKADYNNNVENKTTPEVSSNVWVSSPSLDKSGIYNEGTKQITWKVTFDPGMIGVLTNGDTTTLSVTDTAGKNLEYDDLTSALDDAHITYTPGSEPNSVVISNTSFVDNGDGKFYIEYTTPAVDDAVISGADPNVQNKVKGTYKDIPLPERSPSVDVTGSVGVVGSVDKTLVSSDTDSLTLKWTVDVLIPAEGALDSIRIADDPGSAFYRGDLNMNVLNCTVLKGGIDTFNYKIDGTETPYSAISANIGSVQYKEIPEENLYGPISTTTFESGKVTGFEFTLDSAFIESNRGKTLTIEYESKMDGERYQSAVSEPLTEDKFALISYKNHADVDYIKGAKKSTVSDEAEFVPVINIEAGKFAHEGTTMFPDYGTGGEYPVLAFWDIRILPKSALAVGDNLVIKDTISTGHKYYSDSVRLFSDAGTALDSWASGYESYLDDSVKYNDRITASASGNEVTFTIAVDDRIAAASAAGKRFRILYATAPMDEAVSRAILYGEETVTVSNTADIYHNDVLQVKEIKASQQLKASGEVCGKTQAVTPGSASDSYGKVKYTLNINKPAAKLSSDGKIIVDDWLGGNVDIDEDSVIKIVKKKYNEDTPTTIYYTVKRNPSYNKGEGEIRDFFYLDGVKVEDSMVIKTGVGTKMRFVLDDQTSYVITYDCTYEKINPNLDPVEETARFSNTVVVHNSSKDSISKTVQISYSDYHSSVDVHASSNQKNVIFDIKKAWANDNAAERPDSITLNVHKTNVTTGETASYPKVITLHDNAAIQEDGTWLFSLKLLGYEKVGTNEIYYSYSIDEDQIEGYSTNWSTAFDDVKIPNTFKDANYVVSTVLTNTAAAKFTVDKTNITGDKELEGAHLAIYKADDVGRDNKPIEGKTPVKSWTSDGTKKTFSLPDDDYVLIETGDDFVFDGKTYKVTESAVSFTIDSTGVKNVSGNHTGAVTADDEKNGFITYDAATGTTPAALVVHDAELKKAELKVDKKSITDDSEVVGAKIAIYKKSDLNADFTPKGGATAVDSWTSDGRTHTSTLSDGEYVLIETGDTFEDTVTGIKYSITDSHFSFKVDNGTITDATPVNPIGGSGKMEYTASTQTLKVCDAEVPKAELKVDKKSITDDSEVVGAQIEIYKKSDLDEYFIPNDGATAVDSWTSDGRTHTSTLSDGEYVLIETGDTFEDTVTGIRYYITDSHFSFKVDNGTITDASAVNPTGGSGKMEYTASTQTLKVCDAEVQEIQISKTDMTGNTELPGAVLQIFDLDNKNVTEKYTSKVGETWKVTLEAGTYQIRETVAPDGYQLIATDVEFTVDKEGNVTDIEGSGEIKEGIILVKDNISRITIYKKDISGNIITGSNARFRLTITEPGKTLDGVKFGAATLAGTSYDFDGNTAVFEGLKDGAYTIEELDAPTGYFKTSPIGFTVENGVVKPFDPAVISNDAARVDASGNLSIINKAKGSKSIRVTKNWNGHAADVTSITVELYKSDGTFTGKTLTLNEGNGWSANFEVEEQSGDYYVKEKALTTSYTVTTAYKVGADGSLTQTKSDNVSSDNDSSVTITNNVYVKIKVEKQWEGTLNKEVTVKLYTSTGVYTGKSLTLNAANSWKGEFEVIEGSGNYYVAEDAVTFDGYTVTTAYTVDGAAGGDATKSAVFNADAERTVVVKNSTTQNTIKIKVEKQWTGTQKKEITVRLFNSDGTPTGMTMTLNEGNGWKDEFSVIEGSGNYYVAEDDVTFDGYTVTTAYTVDGAAGGDATKSAVFNADAERTVVVKNTVTENPTPVTYVKIKVEKQWTGTQKKEITVRLFNSDGTDTGKTLTLNEGNGWKGEFEVIEGSGSYYVAEIPVTFDGYTVTTAYTVDGAAGGDATKSAVFNADAERTVVVKNTVTENPTPVTYVKIKVEKQWTGTQKKEITVRLFNSDGTPTGMTMTLNEGNGWKDEFSVIEGSGSYYVAEDAVTFDGYTVTTAYTVDGAAGGDATKSAVFNADAERTVVVKNTVTENPTPVTYVKIKVEKQWTGTQKKEITVRLFNSDGTDTGKTLTLNERNSWKGEFEVIEGSGSYYVAEIPVTFDGYTVTTVYTVDGAAGGDATKSAVFNADAERTVVVTNTVTENPTPVTYVKIDVTKTWTGDPTGITSITAELYKADGTFVESKTLSADSWSASFDVLKDSGDYYVKETAIDLTGFTITATYKVGAAGIEKTVQSDSISSDNDTSVVIKNNAVKDTTVSSFSIIKTDMSGNPIPDSNKAHFTLTVLDDGVDLNGVTANGTVLGAVKTYDYEGNNVVFIGLPDADYTLAETAAPAGYISAGVLRFSVVLGEVQFDTTYANSSTAIDPDGNILVLNHRTPDGPVGPVQPSTPSVTTTTATTTTTKPVVTNTTTTTKKTTVTEKTTVPEETTTTPKETTVTEETNAAETTTTPKTTKNNPETTETTEDLTSSVSTETDTEGDQDDENPHTGREAGITALLVSELAVAVIAGKKKKNHKK